MDREASITFAQRYLEDILSFFGLNVEVATHCEDEVIELRVPSSHLNGFLIGQRGDNLHSMQFLLTQALRNKEAEVYRVNIDIADYKRQKNERLAEQVREWCSTVVESGEAMDLRPMNAADRRVAHHTISEYPSLASHSEGEGRDRHIVISLAS